MRKFLIIALLCLPVSATAQTIPSCERLISDLEILTISEDELVQNFYEGSASAERCVAEDSLTCESLKIGNIKVGSWTSRDGVIRAEDVEWPAGRVSQVDIAAGEWILENVELREEGLSIQRLNRTPTKCLRSGLSYGSVEIGELNEHGEPESFRVNSLPVSSVGLLPPRLRVGDSEFEGSVYASLAQFGEEDHIGVLGLSANFTPGDRFGGGLTFSSADLRQNTQLLSLELNVDDEVTGSALGSFAFHGAEAHRAGGTLRMAPARIWSLRRLENNTWRSTQSSVVGVSLRGPSHELTLGTGVLGHSDLTDIFLRFGASLGTKSWKTHLDLDHESTRAPTQVKHAHSSTLGVRVEHQLMKRATTLKPFVDIVANFGVVPTSVGFEASTSAALMPGAELSTTVIGTFESGRHILRPRIFGSGEVYGFTQRGILSPDETPFPFTRRPGLYHAWAGLEQEWQGSFVLRVPMGIHVQGTASEEMRVLPVTEIQLEIASIRAGGALRCTDQCGALEWRTYAGMENRHVSIEVGAQDHTAWWAPSPGAGPQRRWAFLHQIDQDLGFLSYITGGARVGSTFSHVRLLTDFEDFGVSVGSRWNLSELGWAWGAEAAITPSGDWLGFVGLQMAR